MRAALHRAYTAPEHQSARATVHHRGTRPSHALVDYAHEFAHPACGTVRIISAGDRLRWRGIGLDLPIVHRYRDVFDIVAEPASWFKNTPMEFASTAEGDIERLMVPLEPSVAPIVFRRLPSGPDPAPGRERETNERARALCDRIVAKTDYVRDDIEL